MGAMEASTTLVNPQQIQHVFLDFDKHKAMRSSENGLVAAVNGSAPGGVELGPKKRKADLMA